MKKINLSQGKVALVDDEDFEMLNKYKWYASKEGNIFYAKRNTTLKNKKICIRMHRIIMNPKSNELIDHKDRDGLNNQKSNLRICNHSQNLINRPNQSNNTSGFKGVSWNKERNGWDSYIGVKNKLIHLGRFKNKSDAVERYNEAAKKYFGEFALLNKETKKEMKIWKLGDKHQHYGEVVAMGIRESEPYRFFKHKNGTISLIPLPCLLTEEEREEYYRSIT